MNGLKFIRMRCNISLSELGDVIGVSRQQISAWENGIKPISEERLSQLAEYFGVEPQCLLEISDEQVDNLSQMGLYRRLDSNKEIYSFAIQDDNPDPLINHPTYFPVYSESLDEKMIAAKKKKQETLDHVSDVLGYFGKPNKILEEVSAINRGSVVYELLYDYCTNMLNQKVQYRILYFDILRDVLDALLLANDLISETDLDNAEYLKYDLGNMLYDHRDWIKEEAAHFRAFYSSKQRDIDNERLRRAQISDS